MKKMLSMFFLTLIIGMNVLLMLTFLPATPENVPQSPHQGSPLTEPVYSGLTNSTHWLQTGSDDSSPLQPTTSRGSTIAKYYRSYDPVTEKFFVIQTPPDNIPPELSIPSNITYLEGESGYDIKWTVGDRNPGTYMIYNNSVLVNSNYWTNGTIVWNVDGLTAGIYNFTIIVRDVANNNISDTIWLTVTFPYHFTYTILPELPVIHLTLPLGIILFAILWEREGSYTMKR